jgi:PDZ domain-containing protein
VSDFEPDYWRPQRPGSSRRRFAGFGFLALFTAGLIALVFLPTPYVIESPGPVFNVLSTDKGEPVISAPDAKTFETKGDLDLLTVNVLGSRRSTPSWLEVGMAWLDPAKVVTPIDAIYPVGQSFAQVEAESSAMMEQSQQDAIAVALKKLGYETPTEIYISEVSKNSPSSGKLRATDFIKAINSTRVTDIDQMRKLIAAWSGGQPLKVQVERAGQLLTEQIYPVKNSDGVYRLGILVGLKYDFPVSVNLKLSDVGGPSGGMVFALGIYDVLTPGYLLGGEHIAGTGTIDSNGVVGPIGGIRQKLYGAQRAGAKYFLAPADNCPEVLGHIPEGLRVVKVSNFDQALKAVEAIGTGSGLDALPSCSAK